MMTGAPGGARQREARTAVGNAVRHWLRVRRMGGLRVRLSGRQLIWGSALIFAICIIYLTGAQIGPGLQAAGGGGIRGVWTAQQCTGGIGGCIWYGSFTSADGRVTMPWVMYTGDEAVVHPGWTTPALDTGSADEVYPLHGSQRWVHDLLGLVGGALAIVGLIWRAVVVRRRRRQQRQELGPVWLKPGRPSAQARTQRFLRRHPRSFFTVLTVFFCYVTAGTIYRLVQSHATVITGWPEAVVMGASVSVALMALYVKDYRQRPYGMTDVWPLYGIVGAFMLGLAPNEPLAFSGWAPIPYTVTTAFQAGTLALLAPILLAVTVLLAYMTWATFARRHPWTQPTQGALEPGARQVPGPARSNAQHDRR